jgi:hypothetical protein
MADRSHLFSDVPGPFCATCAQCCKHMPGSMSPYELAQPYTESVRALLASGKWCLDWWEGDVEPEGDLERVYYLRPSVVGRENEHFHAGRGGQCTFLGSSGCQLPREQMPTGCRNLVPTQVQGGSCKGNYDKEQVARDWRPLQAELLAATTQPQPDDEDILDMLESILRQLPGMR